MALDIWNNRYVESGSWTGLAQQNASNLMGNGPFHGGGLGGGGGLLGGGGGGGTSTYLSELMKSRENSMQARQSEMNRALMEQKIQQIKRQMEMVNQQSVQGFNVIYEDEKAAVVEGDTMTVVEAVKPTFNPAEAENEEFIEEYAKLAEEVGVSPPDLIIERFKAFLKKNDIPVFNLKEVVTYMDAKANKESKEQSGWCWKNLRNKDSVGRTFGTRAQRPSYNKIIPASDHYDGESYTHIIPMHALKKVALIDKVFGGTVKMLVCDYATKPEYNPDPFLMAVIPNHDLSKGHGRFVIDFWDEPGFGMEQMLK